MCKVYCFNKWNMDFWMMQAKVKMSMILIYLISSGLFLKINFG